MSARKREMERLLVDRCQVPQELGVGVVFLDGETRNVIFSKRLELEEK